MQLHSTPAEVSSLQENNVHKCNFNYQLFKTYLSLMTVLTLVAKVTGAVDGNAIRVLCRLRAVGADSTSPAVTEALW